MPCFSFFVCALLPAACTLTWDNPLLSQVEAKIAVPRGGDVGSALLSSLPPSFPPSFNTSPSPLPRPNPRISCDVIVPLEREFVRRRQAYSRQRTKRCTPGLFKIFVGGLAPGVNDQEFADYFEPFGTITDSCVIIDHNTGQPKGFGFVTFDSAIPVDEIMHRSDHVIKGKEVYLYACERVSTFLYVNMCECF